MRAVGAGGRVGDAAAPERGVARGALVLIDVGADVAVQRLLAGAAGHHLEGRHVHCVDLDDLVLRHVRVAVALVAVLQEKGRAGRQAGAVEEVLVGAGARTLASPSALVQEPVIRAADNDALIGEAVGVRVADDNDALLGFGSFSGRSWGVFPFDLYAVFESAMPLLCQNRGFTVCEVAHIFVFFK